MKSQRPQFNTSDIERVLFQNKPPEIIVFPFKKSCDERLRHLNFRVRLSSLELENSKKPIYDRLSKIIISIRNSKIPEKELFEFFMSTSVVLNDMIFSEVMREFSKWKSFFYKHIPDYIKSTFSKFQWELIQSVGIQSVLTVPYSVEQQVWIVYANAYHRQEEKKFFIDLVETLKPWMNAELYTYVEKEKTNKKLNIEYQKHKTQMLHGNFGLPEADKQIFKELESNDLDIII
jgi:hypothetical protein